MLGSEGINTGPAPNYPVAQSPPYSTPTQQIQTGKKPKDKKIKKMKIGKILVVIGLIVFAPIFIIIADTEIKSKSAEELEEWFEDADIGDTFNVKGTIKSERESTPYEPSSHIYILEGCDIEIYSGPDIGDEGDTVYLEVDKEQYGIGVENQYEGKFIFYSIMIVGFVILIMGIMVIRKAKKMVGTQVPAVAQAPTMAYGQTPVTVPAAPPSGQPPQPGYVQPPAGQPQAPMHQPPRPQ